MKLLSILYLLLGCLVSYVLYQLAAVWPAEYLVDHLNFHPKTYMALAFFGIFPICLFIGSLVTGYFCQPYLKNLLSFIFISPGIYLTSLTIPMQTTDVEIFLKSFLTFGVVWILSSIGGVYAGRYARLRKEGAGTAMLST